jgi:hypothetical protein
MHLLPVACIVTNITQAVDYATEERDAGGSAAVAGEDHFEDTLALPPSPVRKTNKRKKRASPESDTDFQADSDDESEPEPAMDVNNDVAKELATDRRRSLTNNASSSLYKQSGAGASKISSSSKFPAITIPTPKKDGVRVEIKTPKKPRSPPNKPRSPPEKIPTPLRGGVKLDLKGSGSGGPVRVPSRPTQQYPGIIDLSSPPTSPQPTSAVPAPKVPRTNAPASVKLFSRAAVPLRSPLEPTFSNSNSRPDIHICAACHKNHPPGACSLKQAGVEHCGLCGLAHFGHSRTCPHIKSETQVREMIRALKNSNEERGLVEVAMRYLRGVKGTLVQGKKREREKAEAKKAAELGLPVPQPASTGIGRPAKARPVGAPANGVPPGGFLAGPPRRDGSSAFQGGVQAQPGSVGSALQAAGSGLGGAGARTFAQQQMAQQTQGQGFDDQQVESALSGFLGQ